MEQYCLYKSFLFISLRLHPFEHTPRKLLPFVRGWFFTSISAFQRERLPLHVMTNPIEGRPLCAGQTDSFVQLNSTLVDKSTCITIHLVLRGSNLSKNNDATRESGVHSTVCHIEQVSLLVLFREVPLSNLDTEANLS